MDIKIKYLVDTPIHLEDTGSGDWVDIPLQQNLNLLGHPTKRIPLGIAMQLPKDYEAHIVPNTGAFGNFGLIQTNSISVDSTSDTEAELFLNCYVLVNNTTLRYVPKGTPIAKFRVIKKQPKINFKEV